MNYIRPKPILLSFEESDSQPISINTFTGMNIAGFATRIDDESIEITHENLIGMSMLQYRFGSIKNPFPRGLPWRGQRSYKKDHVVITSLNLDDYELYEEKSGLAGKIIAQPGNLVQLIHSDNDKELNVLGYITQHTLPKIRISHIDPHGKDYNSKRLPIFTDYIPFVNAKHGDKTFALREFNKYRIIK